MDKEVELVQSASRQQAESSANNRIDEYQRDGYALVDQELDVERDSVTVLLVFEETE